MRRRLRQVEPERHHFVLTSQRNQALIQLGCLGDVIRVEHGLADRNLVRGAELRCFTGRSVGKRRRTAQTMQHAVHDEEHRHLQQQRQARGQGIDLVLLIELHHFFVELLAVVFVLSLELLHLGLQTLHLEHALGALQRERCDQDHHGKRHERNGDCVVVGERIELGNEPGGTFKHECYITFLDGSSGTGSNPLGPKGRQRSSRRRVSHRPRDVPCVSIASTA